MTIHDERYFMSPECKCGSRATQRVEGRYLVRRCSKCHSTYYYRLNDGILVPYTKQRAEEIDERRCDPKPFHRDRKGGASTRRALREAGAGPQARPAPVQ